MCLAEQLLGRRVRGRAHDAGLREPRVVIAGDGEPEVADPRLLARRADCGEQDVVGLEVAMDHALAVRVREALARAGARAGSPAPATSGRAAATWPSVSPSTSSITRYISPVRVRPKSWTADDRRMLEPARRLGLAREPLAHLRLDREIAEQHLHREPLVRSSMWCARYTRPIAPSPISASIS